MSINTPNFAKYLNDIVEQGDFNSHSAAAKYIGISPQHFSLLFKGARSKITWDVGNKIIRAHIKIMGSTQHNG